MLLPSPEVPTGGHPGAEMREFDPFDEIGEDPPASQTAKCVRSWTSGGIRYELCKFPWRKDLSFMLTASGGEGSLSERLRAAHLHLSEQEIADWVGCTEREATRRAEQEFGAQRGM